MEPHDKPPSDLGDYPQSPAKRRRLTPPTPPSSIFASTTVSAFASGLSHPSGPPQALTATEGICDDDHENITISATSKHAGHAVGQFLARHVPEQYAPTGGVDASGNARRKDPNTKYCYRHHPDLKCRRQANEKSMDQLQHELEDLLHSDQQAIAHVWSVFSAAPGKQRKLMLDGILTQCCFPQLSHLSKEVGSLLKIDFLSALPVEISYKVLCFLDTTSLCKAAQVSQRWRSLADDDVVWHRMCEQHIDRKCTKCGWGLPLLERKRLRASKRQIQLRATGRGLNEWSPNITPYPEGASEVRSHMAHLHQHHSLLHEGGHQAMKLSVPSHAKQSPTLSNKDAEPDFLRPKHTIPWKQVYKDRYEVGNNWRLGRCSVKILKGHEDGVMCLQFNEAENILATGSYDSTIKIWDLESGEEARTLTGHTQGVRTLQFDSTKLISGSLDTQIKVWNWRTGECLSTYTGHSGGVVGLHFDGQMLATGSMDHSIKIWNFPDASRFTLRGHRDWVNAVRVDSASRTLFSASDDCTIKLWDLDSKTCIKTFEGHVGQVQQVIPLPQEFDLEDADDTSSTTSAQSTPHTHPNPATTSHPIPDPYGPGFTTCDRPLPPKYILSGSLDNTIRLWDTYTGACLRTFFGHVEGIWALAADSLRVVSGGHDGMLKIWDTRSAKCERTFTGHAGPVTCCALSDRMMVSGGEDHQVRVYGF